MARLCAKHGPVRLPRAPRFRSLVEAIVSQQLSTRAADTIYGRLKARVPIAPPALAAAHPATLRATGLSRAKVQFIRALARFAGDGGLEGIARLSDAEVVERLTSVKGIGVWTAEMFLIFSLQRTDIWPVGDNGVQRAARQLYGARSPRTLQRLGERFRPVRSYAAWYLWRSLGDG